MGNKLSDRGVDTKYINRYNALFSKLFRGGDGMADSIYDALCRNDTSHFHSVADVKSLRLLDI